MSVDQTGQDELAHRIAAETTIFRCAAGFIKHDGSFSASLPAPGVPFA